jgi:hypothetical protein
MKTLDPTEHLDIEVIESGFEDSPFTEWEAANEDEGEE